MSQYIRIKKWDDFQHYSDRNPPWIKLHRDMLVSQTWVCLDDAGRVLSTALMLIAAHHDNVTPLNADYIKRRAYLNTEPNFDALFACGFIELCDEQGEVIANDSLVYQNDTKSVSVSVVNNSLKKDLCKKRAKLDEGFDEWYEVYPRKVAKQAALKKWKQLKLHEKSDELIAKMKEQAKRCAAFTGDKDYIPHPATYLHNARWEDDIQAADKAKSAKPMSDAELQAWAKQNGIADPKPGESWPAFRGRVQNEMQRSMT